jgi:hypothetical protein
MHRWLFAMRRLAIVEPDTIVGGQDRSYCQRRPIGFLAVAIVVITAILATPFRSSAVGSEQNADEVPTRFDIPAQPLATALEQFMGTANVSVVVDSAAIAGRTSAALHGQFSPEGGLRSLLIGTGIDPRPIGSRAYTLAPLPHAGAAQSLPRFTNYAMAIQQAVTNALCQRDETRPTQYRLVMRLWLNPEGTVTQVKLGVSTGSPGLDMAIENALEHIRVGAPVPAGLPQPVKLAILPRATSSDPGCSPNNMGEQLSQSIR